MSGSGDALFPRGGTAYHFYAPREVLRAMSVPEVLPVLREAEAALDSGRWIAGYVAFEAAPAFDPAFHAHPPGALPLAWFGVYDGPRVHPMSQTATGTIQSGPWKPGLDEAQYHRAIARIHEHIVAGDTYQVNYTFPLTGRAPDDLTAWFRQLCAAQGTEHAAYVDTGRFKILSASPELFFSMDGDELVCRPMKGTRPRGLWPARDVAHRDALVASEKERAENIMIVDMVRNDLGRIAESGSVITPVLFETERYETVWQMTSTVRARTNAGLAEIFGALFPPASVTGAPKVETMKIIHRLEPDPRGVYCGAVGFAGPERRAEFNIAIRTALVDGEKHVATYHIGSGITHGSEAGSEFRECLDKAALLSFSRPKFELLESLRYEEEYFLFEEHLQRLAGSADYFGIPLNLDKVRGSLLEFAGSLGQGAHKVRLTLDREGRWQITAAPAAPTVSWCVGFARDPVDRRDVFLYHKTTHRETYVRALASRPDCDDVLLWNEEGDVTESCLANVVAEIGGKRYTPPVESGLLAGTFRRYLLEQGEIVEGRLSPEDLLRADAIYLVNSVRRWIPVHLIDTPEGGE